jgi:branched-chain amino acid transport system ATP-binding protein
MNALLELKNLHIAYGGINAVKGISLVVNEGELTTLIGANGAGKTSTLKAIAGMIHSAGGDVVYAGENIANQPSYAIARKGLALVPEGRGVFPQLTVEENLSMGAYARNDRAEIKLDVEKIFAMFARLKERRAQTAGTLSGGEQQMLAIGRALMSRPRLLLLDEPSMGLAPLMVQKIFEVIRTVSASGVTILLVEQNAKLALEASTRGYVMDGGEITLTDDAKALLTNPKVREAYLGES